MNQGLTAVVNIELDKAKKDVVSLQEDIKKLEQQILETRKAKLISSEDTKAVATYNKELQGLSIQLKEKRLALRDATTKVKEQTSANREASKAQQQFTQSVSTSASGLQEINSVLAKYPSSVNATSSSLEALKNRLVELRRLRFSDALNPADQRVLARSIFETTNEIRDQKTALGLLAREAKASEQATKRLGQAQQQFRNQAGASNAVALEFNRIIQDAPFGIIGVGNNIQQLAGNFSVLRASAGSTGAAISGALASIISPANLVLLGISAVTSAWTAYQLGAFGATKKNREKEASLKTLNERTREYIETLKATDIARLNSQKNIDEELFKLESLAKVINNENLSRSNRILAIDELRKLWPGYLKGLSDEEILVNGLKDAYDKITESITLRATALAVEEQIIKLIKEQLELNKKLEGDDKTFFMIQQELFKAKAQVKREQELINEGTVKGTKRLKDAQAEEQKLLKLFQDAYGFVLETEDAIKDNSSEVETLKAKYDSVYAEILNIFKSTKEQVDPVKDVGEAFDDNIFKLEFFNKTVDESKKRLEELASSYAKLQLTPLFSKSDKSDEVGLIKTEEDDDISKQIGKIQQLRSRIADLITLRDIQVDQTKIPALNEQIRTLQAELAGLTDTKIVDDAKLLTDSLSSVFRAFGNQISASLNIGNDSLKAFVSTLISNAPKIVKALQASAKAREVAANSTVASAGKEATAEGISLAAKLANSLGPVGMALLPVFISGAMALIGGAFRKIGGNVPSGGGGGSAVRSASMNTVGSSISGMGSSFNPFGDMQLRTVIRGSNIELLLERVVQEKRA
jgi:hypothetical protein